MPDSRNKWRPHLQKTWERREIGPTRVRILHPIALSYIGKERSCLPSRILLLGCKATCHRQGGKAGFRNSLTVAQAQPIAFRKPLPAWFPSNGGSVVDIHRNCSSGLRVELSYRRDGKLGFLSGRPEQETHVHSCPGRVSPLTG